MAFRDDPDGDQFFALRTFRANGTAKSTPVWLAEHGQAWYGYTGGRSWKVRRIRRDPRVQVAPSDFAGEPRGPWRSGAARVLPRAELRTAKRALRAKYGNKFRFFVLMSLLARPRRGAAVGLEITLEPPTG